VKGGLGTPERLTDANGMVVSSYTVTGLQPSNDTVNVARAGRLWEATTTVNAEQGAVAPAVPFFNARAADGCGTPNAQRNREWNRYPPVPIFVPESRPRSGNQPQPKVIRR
jgi:hypothetical protein